MRSELTGVCHGCLGLLVATLEVYTRLYMARVLLVGVGGQVRRM